MIESILATIFETIFSEYGAFVAFLLVLNLMQWKRSEKKDKLIEGKLVEIAVNNATVIADFTNELREHRKNANR